MSYEFAPANYSLAIAYQAAKARRIRMSCFAMPDEGIFSPREYARRKREQREKERLESLGRSRAISSLSAANATPSLPGVEAKTDPAPILYPLQSAEPIYFQERAPSISAILYAVSDFYRVSVIDLKSARRTQNIVRPRQIAMYLAKTLTTKSLPEVGRRVGGRDHTTVLHSLRKIGALRQTDAALDDELKLLESRLAMSIRPRQIIYYGA